MEKTILLSTALALGFTLGNTHVNANDDAYYSSNSDSDANDYNYSSNSASYNLQQKEVPLTASSNVDSSANSSADSEANSSSDNDSQATEKADENAEQTVAQSPYSSYRQEANYSQTTSQRHYIKVHHNATIQRRQHRNLGRLTIGPKLNVNMRRRHATPMLINGTPLWRVAPMTMDNLLHSRTNNPLAGRRQHISKHIKKLPSVY